MKVTRRQFLETTATALAAQAVPAVRAAPRGKYRTALVGTGWWGMNILREALAAGRSNVVALCDVDPTALESAAEEVKDQSGDQPKKYGDFREMLEREKPDIVLIATPDHWHALVSLAAFKVGAHVFVEKPTGHTLRESRAMLNAAQAAERIVQVGLHRRIGPHHVTGLKFLRDGRAGQIGMVRLFVGNAGGKEQPVPNSDPPKGMDWDLYCGPAPLRPFNRKIHPGGWRGFLDFANGTLGDWGVHWLDQVLAWTEEKYPRRVYSAGGRPISGPAVADGRRQTSDAPEAQVAVYEFESFIATWEHRKFAGNHAEKHAIGCYFYGTKGTFHMGWRDGWTFYPANGREPVIHEKSQLQEPDGHNLKLLWADFVDSIDQRRQPVANIERAHRSSSLSLLGMLSLKLGRAIQWDGARELVVGDAEANALLSRTYRGPWEYPKV